MTLQKKGRDQSVKEKSETKVQNGKVKCSLCHGRGYNEDGSICIFCLSTGEEDI